MKLRWFASIHQSIRPFIRPSVHPSVRPSVRPSVCPSPSVHPSISLLWSRLVCQASQWMQFWELSQGYVSCSSARSQLLFYATFFGCPSFLVPCGVQCSAVLGSDAYGMQYTCPSHHLCHIWLADKSPGSPIQRCWKLKTLLNDKHLNLKHLEPNRFLFWSRIPLQKILLRSKRLEKETNQTESISKLPKGRHLQIENNDCNVCISFKVSCRAHHRQGSRKRAWLDIRPKCGHKENVCEYKPQMSNGMVLAMTTVAADPHCRLWSVTELCYKKDG